MADQITTQGIEISSVLEIVDRIINGGENYAGLKSIFGDDTNFDQDSPDAQLVNIFAQCKRDLAELIVEVFNSFDPDQASGAVLDARVLYNGVIRKGGDYTQTEITIVTNRDVTLKGIDRNKTDEEIQAAGVFTIQDYNGNQYYLLHTRTLAAGTTQAVTFRARYMGDVWYLPNSINQIVTPARGVLSVNNPRQPITVGKAQETDAELKVRRARAVGLGMLGSVEVMQASLRQLTDVVDAAVFENNTNYATEDGIPPHCIWVIVRGGNVSDIADVIYLRLNSGCAMKGDTSHEVDTAFGEKFTINFDVAQKENLSVRLTATPINGVDVMDPAVLADYIAQNYNFWIYQPATATEIDKRCRDFNDQFSYTNIEISADDNTRGQLVTTKELNMTNFNAVNSGSLNVTIDGTTTVQINDMNFALCETPVDVAVVIANAFANAKIPATAEGTGTTITLYSTKRGAGSSIEVNTISTAYQDLSLAEYFDAENMTYTPGVAATQGYQQCNEMSVSRIAALSAITNGSFGIVVNSGAALQIKDLDFTGCTETADVVAVLNAAFNANSAGCYADYENLAIKIYSNLYGASSTIEITAGQTGTNLRTAELLVSPLTDAVDGRAGTNGTAQTGTLDVNDFNGPDGVTNGALSIQVNGANARSVIGINLTQVTSVVEIANIINSACAAAGLLVTVTASGDTILFTSNVAGGDSGVAFTEYTGNLVDISTLPYLDAATMTPTAGVSPTQWDTLLFPLRKKNYFQIEPDYVTVTVDNNG